MTKTIEEIRSKFMEILWQDCDCDHPSDVVDKLFSVEVGGEVHHENCDALDRNIEGIIKPCNCNPISRPKTVMDVLEGR